MRFFEYAHSRVSHYIDERTPLRLLCRPTHVPGYRALAAEQQSPRRRLCGRCARLAEEARQSPHHEKEA